MQEKIIEKIQKLLALSESSNQHEAENALTKAQDLMVKYNIELSQVKNHDSEYINETSEIFKREPLGSIYINDILDNFFFVKIVNSKRDFGKYVNIVGEKQNVKNAIHARKYLFKMFKHLWDTYKKETGASTKSRESFYYGLWEGFSEKMKQQREKTEQEYGLVVVEDPNLNEKLKELFQKLRKSNKKTVNVGDPDALESGKEAGKGLEIAVGELT